MNGLLSKFSSSVLLTLVAGLPGATAAAQNAPQVNKEVMPGVLRYPTKRGVPRRRKPKETKPVISIVPQPRSLETRRGEFLLSANTRLRLDDSAPDSSRSKGTDIQRAEVRRILERWAEPVRQASGFPMPWADETASEPTKTEFLTVRLVTTVELHPPFDTRAEAYRLEVAARGAQPGITIEAADPRGVRYALVTLDQLFAVHAGKSGQAAAPWSLPAVDIDDQPRFRYRGVHLDVGRHFFPVDNIKQYLDLLARYKMNVFHWHLTEDQGWRLEIKKYPRLTEVGAWRRETIVEKNFDPFLGDGVPHGGYYTQDEVREIVAHATERGITVIPEIEMPGHSLAAIAAYPDLACTSGPFEVATRWGVFEDVMCPKEETFTFLQNVLLEVMELFPGPYIHIGGDEVPKARWRADPAVQEIMKREGLASEDELQSWWIRRIERFLIDHDRRLIGWDEILEGGLAPEATVMSWRGVKGGIAAAKAGHDVVMTPGTHCYFDHYQGPPAGEPLAIGGNTPLEKVYSFEPVPGALTPEEAGFVIGAQANLWTEYIAVWDHVQYMLLPRLLALSEVVWSAPGSRDYAGFRSRLGPHLARFDAEGIRYRKPD